MFLTVDELKTHLYAENIDEITQGDETIAVAAIDTAVSEAKGYLSAYDIVAIFGATGANRNALLLTFLKDIAAWHLINLCNAGSDLKLRQDRYERAIAWLRGVQKGEISPDLQKAETSDEKPGAITFGSNPKRNNHF